MNELPPAVLLMPFRDDDADLLIVRDELKEVSSELGINLEEIRFKFSADPVISTIYSAIESAPLIVAVIDDANPNVFYEAGYARGIGRPVLLVAKSGTSVPFNLTAYEHVQYLGGYVNRDADKLRFRIALRKLKGSITEATANDEMVRLRRALQKLELATKPLLFRKCALWNLDEFTKWAETWHGRLQYRGRQQVLEIGAFILRSLQKCGFATLYYPGEESWRPDEDPSTNDEYLDVARVLSRRGVISLTRVFVIKDAKDMRGAAFRNLTFDDLDSGIDARFILEKNLPQDAPRDFAIWDDELLCEVIYSANKPPEILRCSYSADPFDLERARGWQATIIDRSERCTGLPPEDVLLEQSYFIQEDMALRHKSSSYLDAHDASWYYAAWQYLRLCNVVSCPTWHQQFYVSTIDTWLRSYLTPEKNARILISGLADYGMLYHLVAAIGPQRLNRCRIEVIDLSPVPLEMCRWLETILRDESRARLELNLETRNEDLLSSKSPDSSYDLIVSDAFLTRFETENSKTAVLLEWARLLRPNGQIITTVRLKDTRDNQLITDAENTRAKFVDRAVKSWPQALKPKPGSLKTLTEQYAEKITTFPFASASKAQSFLQSLPRLKLLEFHQAVTPGEFYKTPYARVVLSKAEA